jgi:tetratricopeptide (TPR) repeat protein
MNEEVETMKFEDLVKKGNYKYDNELFDEAFELYEKALQIKVDIEIMSKIALIYFGKAMYQSSFEMFSKVLKINPEYSNGYYGLAINAEEMGKPLEAIEYYLEAIKFDPEYITAYFFLANIYGDLLEFEKAKYYYHKAISLNPNFTWAHINVGAIYEQEKNYDLALEHALKAYDIDPYIKYVCFNLGVVCSKLGKYGLAEKYFLEETEKHDGYIYAFLNLGIIYKDHYCDYEKAKNMYHKGLLKDESIGSIWYNLACIYALEHQYDQSYQYFMRAIQCESALITYFKQDEEIKDFKNTSFGKALLDLIQDDK